MLRFLKRRCFYFFVFPICVLLSSHEGFGQYFPIGTDPASVKWRQIKTPNFKVIYPRTWEEKGQYVANGLEYIYQPGSRSLYKSTPRTPVILHNQTTVPSSVTYIAPRRMEFFTTPPQDLFPQDWVDQLIIHEFRHAVGYSAVNQGFTKGVYYILGEQGVFGVFGLLLPMWFIEGDPTVTETALHNTGRGRSPWFEMRLRAQLVEKGIYSYQKANYGSFTDFVPGKYELGYQLVGWSRVNYGATMWSDVIENVGRKPYTIIPFSSAIKKKTGLNKYHLYDTLIGQLRKTWLAEDRLISNNKYTLLTTTPHKFYTSYNLPLVFRDSLIIAVKSSLDDLTKIVLLNKSGQEKPLCTVGANYYSESLSVSDSVIYWSELVNDPRWLLRDYRVVKTYNLITGKTGQLTSCTRYYAPAVTGDGRSLVVVEVTPENKYFLAILNSKDGSLNKKISTPDNLLFIHPRWSDDGKSIVSVVLGKDGNNLAITDPETGKTELLLPFSNMEMKRPSFYRNFILYTASYNGMDNIYAFNRNTKEVSAVTSARFGASDAFVINDKSGIIYSDYTADGYKMVKESLDPSKWNNITVPVKSAFPLAEKLTEQENFIFNTDSVPKIKYPSKPYNKALHLFNIHSWAPVGVDLQNITAAPGVTVISQNLLGTTVSFLGYQYNRNEKEGKYYLSVNNESLYTAIDGSVDYQGRKDIGVYTNNDSIPEEWNEFNVTAGLRLPLNWTRNSWIRSFQPGVSASYKYLRMDESIPVKFDEDQFISINYALLATNKLKTSQRDLFPRWGQELQVNFNNTPFNNAYNSIFAGQLTLDFPGIVRHHGLRLYGAYQKKNVNNYPFTDFIIYPRGYTEISRDEVFSFSAMYSMPLFYPEWELGNLMYFKRFKTTLFYDFANITDETQPAFISSVGLDLRTDFSIFNLIIPFDAGLRSIYVPETGKMQFQMLFSFNFGGMY